MGEIRNPYNILVRTPEGKRPLGRPGCRWEDNTRMHLRETMWENVDWMKLALDRDKWQALVNMVMNPLVPYNVEVLLSYLSDCMITTLQLGTQNISAGEISFCLMQKLYTPEK
jgi:hypothetical protein